MESKKKCRDNLVRCIIIHMKCSLEECGYVNNALYNTSYIQGILDAEPYNSDEKTFYENVVYQLIPGIPLSDIVTPTRLVREYTKAFY